VVDVFDALTTDRPYRKALRPEAAYRILVDEARGGWCPEHLVHRFIDLHRAGLDSSSRQVDDGSQNQSPAAPLN
jgi:HD-GYP domain-containing protein (c-di-GMP phosphodiesterase class II)